MDVFEYADRRPPGPAPATREDLPGWWRGLFLLALAEALFLGFTFLLGIAEGTGLIPASMMPIDPPPLAPAFYDAGWFEVFTHDALRRALTGTAWLFALSLPMAAAFWLAWRWLMDRPVTGLIGPWPTVRRDFALISALGLPILGAELAWVFAQSKIGPQNWAGLFPAQTVVIVLLLPFQTLTEEVIFRGFLQGWLIRRTGRAWLGIWLQAAGFAALHPGTVPVIFVLGLATGYAAQRTGALGASWAIHLLNNAFAICLFFRPTMGQHLLAGYEMPPILGPQLVFLLLVPVFLRLRRRSAASPAAPASD